MLYGIRQFIKAAAALLAALGAAFCVYLMHAVSFSGGESAYYLYSASSQAEIKEALSLAELAHLKGESAVYVFGSADGESAASAAYRGESCLAAEAAKELMASYRARVRFTEEVGGTVSYYCYSPLLKGGVILDGKKINLHVAVRADSLAVGSPIIFGGY